MATTIIGNRPKVGTQATSELCKPVKSYRLTRVGDFSKLATKVRHYSDKKHCKQEAKEKTISLIDQKTLQSRAEARLHVFSKKTK